MNDIEILKAFTHRIIMSTIGDNLLEDITAKQLQLLQTLLLEALREVNPDKE